MIDRSFALGRVLVLLEKLYDRDIFEERYWSRPKEATEWFFRQTKDKQDDVVHEIAYGLEGVIHELAEIISICRGHDDISERENGTANDCL